MHARELIEVSATLCLAARGLLEDSPRIGDHALAEYWAASRCRLDEWGRGLSRLANHSRGAADATADLETLAEEMLLSQVLTRSVAALCVAHDRRRERDDAGPIARNSLAGHDEALSRLRALVGAWWRPHSPRAQRVRLLRNRSERWTDLLLAYVLPLCGSPGGRSPAGHAVEFTFDPTRAQAFAFDAPVHDAAPIAATMLIASVREAFAPADRSTTDRAPLCGQFNRRIAGAALGLFGPEAFDGHGLLRSAWIARLERVADDTAGLVENLFQDSPPAPFRAPERWRI